MAHLQAVTGGAGAEQDVDLALTCHQVLARQVHTLDTVACWGWGAVGYQGRTGDRWKCSQCGRRCRGSHPVLADGTADWRCWACRFVEHLDWCPLMEGAADDEMG